MPTHQTLAIAGSLLTLVALAAVLCFEGREGARRRGLYVAKPLASTGFLLTAAANGALDSSYGVAVFVALMFSFWGGPRSAARLSSLIASESAASANTRRCSAHIRESLPLTQGVLRQPHRTEYGPRNAPGRVYG